MAQEWEIPDYWGLTEEEKENLLEEEHPRLSTGEIAEKLGLDTSEPEEEKLDREGLEKFGRSIGGSPADISEALDEMEQEEA